VQDLALPDDFSRLTEAREIIDTYERARTLALEWQHHRDLISPQMTKRIQRGLAVSYVQYVETWQFATACRERLQSVFADVDVLLAPSATGEAPEGLHSTGDSTFRGLWTLLHVPTISLPTHLGPKGLPVGIQLVARRYEDERLGRASGWKRSMLM
jgi:Asp-tRNA(Asn)/Glu-tRNA(Gln) amidotransferase A subunit family amidase